MHTCTQIIRTRTRTRTAMLLQILLVALKHMRYRHGISQHLIRTFALHL